MRGYQGKLKAERQRRVSDQSTDLAGAPSSGCPAPFPAIQGAAIEPLESTQTGHDRLALRAIAATHYSSLMPRTYLPARLLETID